MKKTGELSGIKLAGERASEREKLLLNIETYQRKKDCWPPFAEGGTIVIN